MSDEKKKPDWKAIGRRSKSRGKRGERRIATLLTEFTGKGFRKTPSSGGYNKAGGVKIAEHMFCGDVICDDPNFALCIEAKNRPDDFQLATLSTVPQSADFTSWWYQTYDDAKRVHLLPLLYFKLGHSTNNTIKNDYLALSKKVFDYLTTGRICHVEIHVYHDPVWVPIQVKVKGQTKKIKAKLLVTLPDPILVSWIEFCKHANKDRLFELPKWVDEEFDQFKILDRSGPNGVLWPEETTTIRREEK